MQTVIKCNNMATSQNHDQSACLSLTAIETSCQGCKGACV